MLLPVTITALLAGLLPGLQGDATEPAPAQAAPARAIRYAALPIRDLAFAPEAARVLQERLVQSLSWRGAEFIDPQTIEEFLRARRVRYTDSLDAQTARALCARTGADHVLLGALLEFDPRVLPRVALSLRVLDGETGERRLSSLAAAAGEDFTGALDLGTIFDVDELALEVLVRALDAFDEAGAPLPLTEAGAGLPSARPGRAYIDFQDPGFDPASLTRVAVMPLADRTEHSGAGLLLADIFGHVWFDAAGVQVVELSELRQAMVSEGLRSIDELDFERMRAIAARVGTPYFQLGSVEVYQPEAPILGELLPSVEVLVRILDVERERVVAGVGLARRGDDFASVFRLGTVRDPVELSRRAAASAVALLVRHK